MNILIDGFFFQIGRTGIARVWVELLTQWSRISPDINFYFLSRGQMDIEIPGVHLIDFPEAPILESFDVWNTKPMSRDRNLLNDVCRERKIDVFFSTYYTYVTECPNILFIHDCIPENFPNLINLDEPIWKLKTEAIYASQAYVAVSENSAIDLLKFYTVEGRPIVIGHNGLSEKWIKNTSELDVARLKSKYALSDNYIVIPGLSSISSYKNQKLVFNSLAKEIENSSIDIVCTGGRAKEEIKSYEGIVNIEKIKISNFSEDDLVTLIAGALVVAYPSIYEGFGLPLIEAFSQGTPVITCNNSSLFEVGKSAALYVDKDDEAGFRDIINQLINTEIEAKKSYSKYVKLYANKFRWIEMAHKVDSLTRQLILQGKHEKWMLQHGY
jgi:glycosyltransferase involved in cell wall biosynthesis